AAHTAVWARLIWTLPALGLATLPPLVGAAAGAMAAFPARGGRRSEGLRARLLVAWLHLLQPAARLSGRLHHGLTPWRRRGPAGFALPVRRRRTIWSETWRSTEDRVHELASAV